MCFINIKYYSIDIGKFSVEDLSNFLEVYDIELGCHTSIDLLNMSSSWPWLEFDQDYKWMLMETPSKPVLDPAGIQLTINNKYMTLIDNVVDYVGEGTFGYLSPDIMMRLLKKSGIIV